MGYDFVNLDKYNAKYEDGFLVTTDYKRTPAWKKFDECFNSKSGICYVDNEGNEYEYSDLYGMVLDDDAVTYLYQILNGDSPVEEMENDWHFSRCKCCGNWVYAKNVGFFQQDQFICKRCTPVRSNGVIKLWKDPYDDDRRMFVKTKAKFQPGVTVLVGCNGVGKSTLLDNIRSQLKSNGIPYISFDNLGEEGGQNNGKRMLSHALMGIRPDPMEEKFATLENGISQMFSMSEGEKIRAAILQFTHKIAKQIELYNGYGEFWVMFDALDSGLSYDVICDIKKYIFDAIVNFAPPEMRVYVIVSCNSYEMCEGNAAFSIEKMKYINIRSYNAFAKAILSSAVYKEKRDRVFGIKAEIWGRPYEFVFDEDIASKFHNYKTNNLMEGICATMKLDGYLMELKVSKTDHREYQQYILHDPDGKRIPVGDVGDLYGSIRRDDVERTMHDAICREIFRKNKKNY